MSTPSSPTGNPAYRAGAQPSFAFSNHFSLSLLAVLIGAIAAYGVIAFRLAFRGAQKIFYGFSRDDIYMGADTLEWWHLLLAPTLGGLIIGLFVYYFSPGRRPHGAVDAMQAVKEGEGKISLKEGLSAAAVSAASIGVGASVGLYGPAVHLGASLGSWLARLLRMHRSHTLTLLGCGVSSAIAASFNAPIAGVIFVHEVMLGHYALSAFAPITIASVVGTVTLSFHLGDVFAFHIPETRIDYVYEYPIFALLGLASAVIAIIYMRGMLLAEKLAQKSPFPPWARPMVGGLLIGLIALAFPQVLGLGNETINAALNNLLPLGLLLALIAAKILATAISIGFGFGGGVFGPSLFLGAMLGSATGVFLNEALPGVTSAVEVYTLVGMGALISCVIGAPITTILIIFEITSSYAVTTAVMIAAVIANIASNQFFARSFFLHQLQARGIDPDEGREVKILKSQRIDEVMSTHFHSVPSTATLAEIESLLISMQVRRREKSVPDRVSDKAAFNSAPDRRKKTGTFHGRRYRNQDLLVIGGKGELLGQVTLFDLAQAQRMPEPEKLTAGEIISQPDLILEAGTNLHEAMQLLSDFIGISLPVVENIQNGKLVGLIYESTVIDAYNQAIAQARAEERGLDYPLSRKEMGERHA